MDSLTNFLHNVGLKYKTKYLIHKSAFSLTQPHPYLCLATWFLILKNILFLGAQGVAYCCSQGWKFIFCVELHTKFAFNSTLCLLLVWI